MKQRRFLALIAAVLMLLMSVSLPGPLNMVRETEASSATADPMEKDYATQGRCGDKLYWEFNTYTGELTITGSGPMYDKYPENTENPSCFAAFAGSIRSVSLPKGITSIGAYAFYNCTSLTGITLPGKVKTIGERAFNGCASLMSITLPASLVQIGPHAFGGCQKLDHVYYQGSTDKGVKLTIFAGNYWVQNATWHYTKISTARLSIKTQPKNIRVDEGKVAAFKVKAAGAVRIEWQYQPAGSSNWYDMQIIGDTCTVLGSSLYDGYAYRCKVSSGTSSMYSSPATLTVKLVDLAVKTQPRDVKVYEGKTATFKVKAVGATHIQWMCKWADDDTWYNWVADQEVVSFTPDADDDGMLVCAVVSNDRGDSLSTKEATLGMNIKIVKQPKAAKVVEGEKAQFTVDATGFTDVQWEYHIPGEEGWFEVGGGVYETCTILAKVSYTGFVFRCRLYNNTSVKYSSQAKLTVKPAGLYRAVLVGENNYEDSPLKGCVNDMNTMAGMLRGLTNSFTTKTLPNSTKSEIMNAISTTFADTTSDSVSLFYYSGHGLSSSSSSYYHGALVAIDEKYITFSELASALSKVKGRVIVILDSCFSGASINKAAGDQDLDKMMQAYNKAAIEAFSGYYLEGETAKSGELAQSKFIVISASSKTETSHDYYYDGSGYRQGQFTAALIKGMGCKYPSGSYSGSMPADKNSNKLITLSEIYTYAYNQAISWSGNQHAQYYGTGSEVMFRRK